MAKKHSDLLIKEIRKEYESGSSISQLSKKYKVSSNTIKYWSTNNGWKKKKQNQPTTNQPTEIGKTTYPTNQIKEVGRSKKEIIKAIDKKIERDRHLNSYEKDFCHIYIKTFNGALAVKKAGYTTKYPERYAYTLLQKDKIKKYINELQDEIRQNVIVNMGNVIDLMKRVAFADIADFVEFGSEEKENSSGEKYKKNYINFKDIEEVDGQLINEVSVGKDGIKVKLVSKEKALEFLAKYMDYPDKLAKERFEHDKEKYDDEKAIEVENEKNSKNIITEIIGKADLNAKNNNS